MKHLTGLIITAGLAIMTAGVFIADAGAGIALWAQRLESRRGPGRLEVIRLGLAILFNSARFGLVGV